MTDYSEIMQYLPSLLRQREDALRDCDFEKAMTFSVQIIQTEYRLYAWLSDKLWEEKK